MVKANNNSSAAGVVLEKVTTAHTSKTRDPRDAMERQRVFRPRSDLTAVRGILEKVLARRGLAHRVHKYEFLRHWQEIVGSGFAAVSKPECIQKNTLIVRVISSGWAQEMGFLKPILLQKIAKFMPSGQQVHEIAFRVGPL